MTVMIHLPAIGWREKKQRLGRLTWRLGSKKDNCFAVKVFPLLVRLYLDVCLFLLTSYRNNGTKKERGRPKLETKSRLSLN
jgi:hypothetical protein